MNSIVYKPLITRGDLAADTTSGLNISNNSSSPRFKYTGYKPQYNWRDSSDTSTESETTATQETAVTPEDHEVDQQIEWEDPSTINWETTPATITSVGTQQQSIITPVQHVFKTPDIDTGEMKEFLDVLADAGIAVRVTSGARPGARTSSGNTSWHSLGRALDITPVSGTTREDFNKLKDQILNAPTVIKYMQDHNIGILDETLDETLQRTGGSGWHFHIGPDQSALKGLQTWLNDTNHLAKYGMKFPILAHSGTKFPVILAAKGTNIPRKQQKLYDRVTERLTQQNQNKNISPITGLKYEEPLQPLTQEIMSFIPGIGDAIEASSIIGNLLNDNWKQALISAGLLILPGNASKISKNLGFKYPYFDLEYITESGNLIKNRGIDKEIKNTESLLAKRYSTKGNRIPELPQELNGEQVSDIIQNWEPQIREVVTPPDGARASNQIGWYRHNNSNNQPLDVSIGDKNLTTKELNTEFTPEVNNYPISEESRRQILDHELSHWLDYTFRPEIRNSEIKFLTEGTEEAVKDPFEIIARTGQVKSYNKISDGSQTFTGDQYKKMFENYINNKRNPDNYISLLKQRIKDWDAFAKWANENIPLATRSTKPFLWTPHNSEEDD